MRHQIKEKEYEKELTLGHDVKNPQNSSASCVLCILFCID